MAHDSGYGAMSSSQKRASLLRKLPQWLATYCQQHGAAPEMVHSHADQLQDSTEDPGNVAADASIPPCSAPLSLEGFFVWLDTQAGAGSYAGVVKHDMASQIEFLREFLSMPLGSGNKGKPLQRTMCANHTPDSTCDRTSGHTVCENCLLVKYCSPACLTSHYRMHCESICKSLVVDLHEASFPLRKQLNMSMGGLQLKTNEKIAEIHNPALPVYGLLDDLNPFAFTSPVNKASISTGHAANLDEGPSKPHSPPALPDHLHLFFPALYDLRNIFQTVCNIPDNYTGTVCLFLNFPQARLAVRDFLILELLRYYGIAGIDLAIAIWHSTALTAIQDTHLLLTVSRMLRTWQSSLPLSGEHSVAAYKEPFPSSKKASFLKADFGTDVWSELKTLACSDTCEQIGFCPEHQYVRRWSNDAALKIDACRPAHLACWQEYERSGLALPFGTPNSSHNIPNRLRYDAKVDRIARYENDPLSGWDLQQLIVLASQRRGASTNDLYGCVFFYLRDMMEMFLLKTAKCCVQLRLTGLQPQKLIEVLRKSGMKFHRIDACPLDLDDGLCPDEMMQLCAGLLAQDAAQAWPSLLLTATLRKWLVEDVYGENLMADVYRQGMESRKRFAAMAHDMQSNYMRIFWHAVDPIIVTSYLWNFTHKGSALPSFADHVDRVIEGAATGVGLYKQRWHRIVSPRPGIALRESQKPLDQLVSSYVNSETRPYFNLLFSGFTFQERFYEWGWEFCN